MKKFFITSFVIMIIITFGVISKMSAVPPVVPEVPSDFSASSTVAVVRVIDGDTFVVLINDHEEKVRMLGIDAPESVDPRRPVQCFGKEASAHLRALLDHAHVNLVTDPTNSDRDKFNRLLRYVYFTDGTDVNARMITDGYAFTFLKYPFQKRAEYLKLQSAARAAGVGLWSSTTCAGRHG